MVVFWDVVEGAALGGAVERGMIDDGRFVGFEGRGGVGDGEGARAAEDGEREVGFHGPDADCAVSGACYNFFSGKKNWGLIIHV